MLIFNSYASAITPLPNRYTLRATANKLCICFYILVLFQVSSGCIGEKCSVQLHPAVHEGELIWRRLAFSLYPNLTTSKYPTTTNNAVQFISFSPLSFKYRIILTCLLSVLMERMQIRQLLERSQSSMHWNVKIYLDLAAADMFTIHLSQRVHDTPYIVKLNERIRQHLATLILYFNFLHKQNNDIRLHWRKQAKFPFHWKRYHECIYPVDCQILSPCSVNTWSHYLMYY